MHRASHSTGIPTPSHDRGLAYPPDLAIFSGLNHFQVHEPASEYTGPPQSTRARLRQNHIKLARPVPELTKITTINQKTKERRRIHISLGNP